MYKNILVTGGAGYIGSHVVLNLTKANLNPIVLDNLCRGNKEIVDLNLKVPLIIGDISDTELLKNILNGNHPKLEGKKIDAVMHFAAYAYVGESIEKPLIYFKNNVCKTIQLLDSIISENIQREICKKNKIPFIFSSTCATYGIPKKLPITEETEQVPINPYGKSKLMIENVLKDLAERYALPSVIYRYFNAAGADPKCLIGELHDPETHLIPRCFQAIEGYLDVLKIFGDDYDSRDGSCIRDFIHVNDIAEAHILGLNYIQNEILSRKNDKNICEAFNLGNGNGYSVKEVVKIVEEVTGRKVPVEFEKRRSGDPPILYSATKKAELYLGWKPRFPELNVIIKHAWNWFDKRNKI